MRQSEETIFRLLDYSCYGEVDDWIKNLKLHIKEWVLSPFEMDEKWISTERFNIIKNPHLISVYTWDEKSWLRWNHWLHQFDGGRNEWLIGIILDAPTVINPEIRWPSMEHLVIDARRVPINERKIIGIVVDYERIKTKWRFGEILDIGNTSNLTVYRVNVWLSTDMLNLDSQLEEIPNEKDSSV